ncbi:hypothetical protein QQP08_021496 [Theobroma cacao]|nr:hypothetical protein QQP08_021496 [Theobroma cacao]
MDLRMFQYSFMILLSIFVDMFFYDHPVNNKTNDRSIPDRSLERYGNGGVMQTQKHIGTFTLK